MNILRIDPFHGASGDMLLAALIDAGVPEEAVFAPLQELLPGEFHIEVRKVRRHLFAATEVTVTVLPSGQDRFRNLQDILEIVHASSLSLQRKCDAEECIRALAEAEGKIHGIEPESVHFHEVGAVDTVVDLLGFMFGLEYFDVADVYVSEIATGTGCVGSAHGELPLPSPAVMELLKGFPLKHCPDIHNMELCTPTGAMIIAGVGRPVMEIPVAMPLVSGYGAGAADPVGFANCLRVTVMEVCDTDRDTASLVHGSDMIRAETVIDDQTPEQVSWASEQIRKAGALETAVVPVMLKKGRTGFLLVMLFEQSVAEQVFRVLFRETTTFGVRYFPVSRKILDKRFVYRKTPWGIVRVKQGFLDGMLMTESPEFDDCVRVADGADVPLKDVFSAALVADRDEIV